MVAQLRAFPLSSLRQWTILYWLEIPFSSKNYREHYNLHIMPSPIYLICEMSKVGFAAMACCEVKVKEIALVSMFILVSSLPRHCSCSPTSFPGYLGIFPVCASCWRWWRNLPDKKVREGWKCRWDILFKNTDKQLKIIKRTHESGTGLRPRDQQNNVGKSKNPKMWQEGKLKTRISWQEWKAWKVRCKHTKHYFAKSHFNSPCLYRVHGW